MAMDGRRKGLLGSWARYVASAAASGALTGNPVGITQIQLIIGPRAGALLIRAGLEAGSLMRALKRDDCANLRQFVTWSFTGSPQCYMAGRDLRVEAGWPAELAERQIRLSSLCKKPEGGGKWVCGRSELGSTVVPSLSDVTPHWLISGATGSGKSVALRGAVLQLSQDHGNSLVLVDGKAGEGLKGLEHLQGVIGPCAIEGADARAALGWSVAEMRRRYANGHVGRLVCVIDEFQELVEQDEVIVNLLRKLAAQGRAANVHLLLATQHPTVDAFGDASTRRNLPGKLALRVTDADASRVAVGGSTPRADYLLSAGDSYLVAPGAVHRVQVALVDNKEIGEAEPGEWELNDWPDYDATDLGQDLRQTVNWSYSGSELAVSILSASYREGRRRMVRRLEQAGQRRPGSDRAVRLLALGRDAWRWFDVQGYALRHEAGKDVMTW